MSQDEANYHNESPSRSGPVWSSHAAMLFAEIARLNLEAADLRATLYAKRQECSVNLSALERRSGECVEFSKTIVELRKSLEQSRKAHGDLLDRMERRRKRRRRA